MSRRRRPIYLPFAKDKSRFELRFSESQTLHQVEHALSSGEVGDAILGEGQFQRFVFDEIVNALWEDSSCSSATHAFARGAHGRGDDLEISKTCRQNPPNRCRTPWCRCGSDKVSIQSWVGD